MTTHKILMIILLVLAVFFGVNMFLLNKKMDEVVIPRTDEQIISTTTAPIVSTTTVIATPKFPKEVALTTQNYFEFPDNSILVLKKINDSRCPLNVNCVWAGNVVATFTIKKGADIQDVELKFGPGTEATSHTYNGYMIKIVQVSPDKGSADEIMQEKKYVVTLRISK